MSTLACSRILLKNHLFTLLHRKSLLLYLIIFTNMKIWYSSSQLKTKQQQKMSLINHSSHLPISVFPFPAETSHIWYPYLPGESRHHFLSILSWPHYNQNFNNTSPLIWLFLWSQCSFHCQINSSSYSIHQWDVIELIIPFLFKNLFIWLPVHQSPGIFPHLPWLLYPSLFWRFLFITLTLKSWHASGLKLLTASFPIYSHT